MYPYNHRYGQTIQTDASKVDVDRSFIAHISIKPAAQNVTGILAAAALTAAEQVVAENITQPDVPRNVKIKGNAEGIAGNVVVTGTNIDDQEISEIIALDGTNEVQGNKAFKTIASINLPVETHEGTDTVSIGMANKLGLPYLLAANTVIATCRNGVQEIIPPTVAINAEAFESNTVLLNSTLNGTDIDLYLIV